MIQPSLWAAVFVMNKTLERNLIERFPSLFRDMYKEGTLMKVGCSIENGWYGILETLCEALDDPKFKPIELRLYQVKQKFGVMVVHLDSHLNSNDNESKTNEEKGTYIGLRKDADHLVSVFTNKSVKICEKCGSTHLVKTQPIRLYFCTLCNECATFAVTNSLGSILEFTLKTSEEQ